MDNLKMARAGTHFSDGAVSIAWASGRNASEVVAVTPANRSSKLLDAIHAGTVVETADAVTPITPPAGQSYHDHNALTNLTVGDVHTQYQKESERAAASGYASLDGSTKVPIAQVPTGATSSTVSLGNHTHTESRTITFLIDGAGSTITTGVKGDLEVGFNCTITAARLLADQSGAIVVNVWKDTYANFPPVVGDKITASAPPTITASGTKSQDTTLTGWTTSISAGDILRFNVDSVTTIQRVTLSLTVSLTV